MKKINIPIYNCDIIYKVTNDFVGWMHKKGIRIDEDSNENKGLCIHGDRHQIYILINKDRWNVGTVIHECLHATNMILESRGVEVSLTNDEAQAYLLTYIINRIL